MINIADPQTFYRLMGASCHHRIGMLGESFQRGLKRNIAAVPHGDGDIAEKAGVFCSPDGRVAKPRAKLDFRQRCQFLERWGERLRLKS